MLIETLYSPNGCQTDEEIKKNSSTKYHFDVILILNYLHYPFINAGRYIYIPMYVYPMLNLAFSTNYL